MHLNQLVKDVQDGILDFKIDWLKKHQENPEQYPLELPEDNAGLWYEFFIEHLMKYADKEE